MTISASIPTYLINKKGSDDKMRRISDQFCNKPEFSISRIDPVKYFAGDVSFLDTLKEIIRHKIDNKEGLFIICEDDHLFTEAYDKELFFNYIVQADKLNADMLLGGVSWYRTGLEKAENLFLIDLFLGLQFTVIYSRFFLRILESEFSNTDNPGFTISALAKNKFVIYPFISVQKKPEQFSGTREKKYLAADIVESFDTAAAQLNILTKVKKFYQSLPSATGHLEQYSYQQTVIPVYIINLPERAERLKHIKEQFKGKDEFETVIIQACKHKIGAIGLWNSIVKIINRAIENDDDVIIICEDDHQFTKDYSKEYLLKNILEAHHEGVAILSGGACGFGQVVPITRERYWVNPLKGTQFIVIYKKIFQRILKYKFRKLDTADGVLSALSSNIMLLCPFVSVQKDFGYSDITKEHNEQQGLVSIMFDRTQQRLQNVKTVYFKI